MQPINPLARLEQQIGRNREEYQSVLEQLAYWTGEKKRLEYELTFLNQSYRIAGGVPAEKVSHTQSIAQMAEEILRTRGKLHVDEMTALMAQPPYNRVVEKQSVVATLVKAIARGEVFERVGRNTFGLLAEGKEGNM